jgi:hypothetical protein
MKKILVFLLVILNISYVNAQINFWRNTIVSSELNYNETSKETKTSDKDWIVILINYTKYFRDKYLKDLLIQKIQIKESFKTKYDTLLKIIDLKVAQMNDIDNMSKIIDIINKKLESKNLSKNNSYILNYLKLDLWIQIENTYLKSPDKIIWVYNQRTKRARDLVRENDIQAIRSWIEMYYQDFSSYPELKNLIEAIKYYINVFPKETLWNVEINWCKFWYKYSTSEDKQHYILSSCLENSDPLIVKSSNINIKYWSESYIDWFTNWKSYNNSFSWILVNNSGSIYLNWENIDYLYDYKKIFNQLNIDYLYDYKKIFNQLNISSISEIRDISRFQNLITLEWYIEMYYQDKMEYPENINWIISKYDIKDVLDWQTINWCKFWYTYKVFNDANKIKNQKYILSSCAETNYYKEKSKNDWWNDSMRYEIWNFK